MRIVATIYDMFHIGRHTHVLSDVRRILANSLLKAFHEIHQVLHRVLLLADLTLVAGVVDNIV